MRKSIAVLLIMFFLFPTESLAFKLIENTNPTAFTNPTYDAYRNRYISTWDKSKVTNFILTSYGDDSYSAARTTKVFKAMDEPKWIDFQFGCNTFYLMESFDSGGKLIGLLKFESTQIINPDQVACNSKVDGEEGGSDGEGGEESEAPCDVCTVFSCPGWDLHLEKLDAIKNAIPPPPNWNQVSQTFSDAIVPRLVSETKTMLTDLLGRAPAPPPALPDLPPLNDHNFEQKKPVMQEVPGLEGFTKDDVQDGAPVLPYEEDPTGGFNLTVDPVSNLPDVVPGGDPGIYKRDPVEPSNPMPGAPRETEVDMGSAPVPNDGGSTPPTPGESGGTPPKPDDGVDLPGKPNDVEMPGKDIYMPKPKGG